MVYSTIVETRSIEAVSYLEALADPVRLALVVNLAGGERCVCELQERVAVAPNLLSYHLRVLREAGLVIAARRGRWMDYRLDGDGFAAMWASLASVGVPFPGETTSTERARRSGNEQGAGR